MTYLLYIVDIMGVDVLATQEGVTSHWQFECLSNSQLRLTTKKI